MYIAYQLFMLCCVMTVSALVARLGISFYTRLRLKMERANLFVERTTHTAGAAFGLLAMLLLKWISLACSVPGTDFSCTPPSDAVIILIAAFGLPPLVALLVSIYRLWRLFHYLFDHTSDAIANLPVLAKKLPRWLRSKKQLLLQRKPMPVPASVTATPKEYFAHAWSAGAQAGASRVESGSVHCSESKSPVQRLFDA